MIIDVVNLEETEEEWDNKFHSELWGRGVHLFLWQLQFASFFSLDSRLLRIAGSHYFEGDLLEYWHFSREFSILQIRSCIWCVSQLWDVWEYWWDTLLSPICLSMKSKEISSMGLALNQDRQKGLVDESFCICPLGNPSYTLAIYTICHKRWSSTMGPSVFLPTPHHCDLVIYLWIAFPICTESSLYSHALPVTELPNKEVAHTCEPLPQAPNSREAKLKQKIIGRHSHGVQAMQRPVR